MSPREEIALFTDAAHDYLSRGWSVMPIMRSETKMPAIKWKHLQERRPTPKELTRYFSFANRNIGVITGSISGFFALDVDGEEGFETILKYGEWPQTIETQSRPFRHQLWFQLPSWKVSNAVKFLPGLDLRGDGGYVQAPPSIHKTGSLYRWVNHPDNTPLAIAPDWLLERTVKEEIPPCPAPPMPQKPQEYEKRYVWSALEKERAKLASTSDGNKYDQLRRSGIAIAGFIWSGAITAGDIKDNLLGVVLPRARNKQTAIEGLESAIAYGSARPRVIPPR